jgi:hypothetical protein
MEGRHRGVVTTSQAHPRVEKLAGLTVATATAAAVIVGCLTVMQGRQVDPITDPVSDYALHGGGEPLFVLAVLLMITGGLAVRAAMNHTGMPHPRSLTILFGLWYAGLAVCAVFPGNRSATETTVAGDIHRFGGALFLACLPVVGWQLARSLRVSPLWTHAAARIRWFALAGGATAVAFGVSQFAQWLPLGLIERFALGAQLALLVVLASTVRRAVR